MNTTAIKKIWHHSGQPNTLLLIRFDNSTAEVRVVGRRPWCEGGFGSSVLHTGDRGSAVRYLRYRSECKHLPAAILIERDDRNTDVAEVLDILNPASRAIYMQYEDDIWFSGQQLPPVEEVQFARGASLTVRGRNTVTLANREFPVQVLFTVQNPQRERDNVIQISVQFRGSIAGVQLPPPRGVRITGADTGILEIGIGPGLHHDQWRCSILEGGGRTAWLDEHSGADGPDPPARLMVIFDRTCPDASHWVQARSLVFKPEIRQKTGQGDDVLPYHGYNAEIREGLAAGLAVAFRNKPCEISLISCADTFGNDVAPIEDVDFPPATHSLAGTTTDCSSDMAGFLDTLPYSPGLDLWDPLDDALKFAALRLRDEARPCGILIVGNSPPTFPTQSPSPLEAIATCLGVATSYRHRSPLWHEQLEFLASRHIPVVYLFLTMRGCPPPLQRDFDLFRVVETAVLRAIENSPPLRTITRTADAKGVEAGVLEAIDLLGSPAAYSTVEVSE